MDWKTYSAAATVLVVIATGCSAAPRPAIDAKERCERRADGVSAAVRIEACNQAIADEGNDPLQLAKYYVGRGNAYKLEGGHVQAVADYTKAIQLNPASGVAFANRALARDDDGDHAGAEADATRAIELMPSNPEPYDTRGNARDALGRHAEALADYNRAIALDPNYGLAFYNRGVTYQAIGETSKAFDDFSRAADLRRDDPSPLVDRAVVEIRLGRNKQAVLDLNAALRLQPNSAVALVNRGEALAASSDSASLSRAMTDFDQAIALEPRLVEALCQRSKLRDRLGNRDGSRSDRATANAIQPGACA